MGKYEKKKSDFDDIRNIFAKRDQNRSAQNRHDQEAPETPEPVTEPRRIREDAGYSVEAMRDVHEGRAVYESSDARNRRSGSRQSASGQQPVYVQEPCSDPQSSGSQPVCGQPRIRKPRRRKKHRFLRFLGKTVLVLLALLILAGALSLLLAKMPESDAPIGPRKDGCCTVLLCGVDEDGTRTDTMLLLYLDRNGKNLRLLSLPRDTMVNRDNPVPKLNGAYGANGKGRKGMNVLMDYVKDLVGYRPDGYMLIDLNCFEDLVDTMGGVTYDVPMDMYYNDPTQDLFIDLKAGVQELNGKEAMWLVRFRSGYAMADLDRVRVQRDFLAAAVNQWKSITRLPRVPFAAILLMRNTETDLSYRNLCWVALTLARCGSDGLESDTLPGKPATVKGGSYYVEDRQAAAELVNEKYNPYEKQIHADDLHPYGY